MAGPDVTLMLTPISLAIMWARVVLPRPGGPYRIMWSRGFAAHLRGLDADSQVFLHRRLADEFIEPARAQGNVGVFIVRLGIAGDYASRGFGVPWLGGAGVGQVTYPDLTD